MTTTDARCEVCQPLHDRIALGSAAYTASRISGVSAARLTKLEFEVNELAMILAGHHCDGTGRWPSSSGERAPVTPSLEE